MEPLRFPRAGSYTGAFVAHHATHLHPPYGLWRVVYAGREIGRQLSVPSLEDCERMLATQAATTPGDTPAAPLTPDALRRIRGNQASALVNRNRTTKRSA